MRKILAIDDNRHNLELVQAFLSVDFPDYKILLTQSGKEGVEIAKRERPDTILLDILMPEMDGFEVCEILKNDDTTKHIPILLISAMGDVSYRIKGLNTGADAFISKPFDKAELKAQMNVMLRIKFAEDLLRKRNENLEILIKKQTAEFHNTEERYLKVSAYALEFFWEVDTNGLFTYVSPVVSQILGYHTEEIVGKKHLFDFCSYNGHSDTRELVTAIFEKRENFTGNEVLCSHKNEEKVWLSINGFPVLNEEQEFSGYIGVNHDITRRREAEEANKKHLEAIEEYQKKLKDLNYQLTVAEEKERRKIAEYLHDGLGQILSIASIKLSAIANEELPENVKKTLNESSELIREGVAESKTLVYDLSPPILYELGLVAAVKWKVEQIEKKFGLITVFKSEEQYIDVENDIKVFLFRIVCELINNCIKHSEADLLKVEIQKNQKNIRILVIDNGKGFNYNKETNISEVGGFGLFSINERLDTLGGSLVVESEQDKGSKLIVTVPI